MLNRAELIGHLGADPEIRSLNSGDKIASFRVATSVRWTDKNTGEKREQTEWHTISVFGEGIVGVVERFLHKGSKVYLAGRLRTRSWTDSDNVKRYATEIVVSGASGQLTLLDKREGTGYQPPNQDDLDDEIPF